MRTFFSVLQKCPQHFPHHTEYCLEAEAKKPGVLMETLQVSKIHVFPLLSQPAGFLFDLPVDPAPGAAVEVGQRGEGSAHLGEIHQAVLLQSEDELARPLGEVLQHQHPAPRLLPVRQTIQWKPGENVRHRPLLGSLELLGEAEITFGNQLGQLGRL